jgi:signal transduction histidine kinase
LYSISIEIAMLHELPPVLDLALGYCLELTESEFGFVGLLDSSRQMMEVAAIKGFVPSDPEFHERFRMIPVRPTLFGIVIREGRSNISNDVLNDPRRMGQPFGHPPVRTYLGVPLKVREEVIGMVGVANRAQGYAEDNEHLLSTFGNQIAVAVANARLYEDQREMIHKLELLHHELDEVEREGVLRKERARIAADLHDRLEQAIFSIGLQVNTALERPELEPETANRLREIRRLAAGMSEAIKEVIFATSSPSKGVDLPGTLRRLVRDVGRGVPLQVDLVVSGPPVRLAPAVETALCRVAEGALLNVLRHAGATMALVSLHYSPDHVDLVVQDDGTGAPQLLLQSFAGSATHFGLRSMKGQVEELGGTFTVANGEEGGLAVRVRIPAQAT